MDDGDFKSGAFNRSATHPSISAAIKFCNHVPHGPSSDPIITQNDEMATTVETGFSNVDASRDAGNLVDYLGFCGAIRIACVQPLREEG